MDLAVDRYRWKETSGPHYLVTAPCRSCGQRFKIEWPREMPLRLEGVDHDCRTGDPYWKLIIQ